MVQAQHPEGLLPPSLLEFLASSLLIVLAALTHLRGPSGHSREPAQSNHFLGVGWGWRWNFKALDPTALDWTPPDPTALEV
jgi:hypothetical protein